MFDLYSFKECVWPENVINYINMVLTAFEVYKTENRMLYYYNKTVNNRWKLYTLLKMFSSTPQWPIAISMEEVKIRHKGLKL